MQLFGTQTKRIAWQGGYADKVYVGPYLVWESPLRIAKLEVGAFVMSGSAATIRKTRVVLASGSFVMTGESLRAQPLAFVLSTGSFAMGGESLYAHRIPDWDFIAYLNVSNSFTQKQTITLNTAGVTNLELHLNDDSNTPGPILDLIRHSTTPAANDFLGNIRFYGYNDAAAQVTAGTMLAFLTDAAAATFSARLEFRTTQAAVGGIRFYIGAGIWVGTATGGDQGAGTVNAINYYLNGVLLKDVTEILTNKTLDDPIVTGLLDLQGGQIEFPAAQSPSSDPNTLDDYEEGLWTPVFTFTTPGDLAITYSIQEGSYVKIGRICVAKFRIVATAGNFTHSTASGSATVTGLPFTSESASPGYGTLVFAGITKANYTQFIPQVAVSTQAMTFQSCGQGVAGVVLAAADVPSGGLIRFNGVLIYATVD